MPGYSLFNPSEAHIDKVLQESTRAAFNYVDVCSTLGASPSSLQVPPGPLWKVDHTRAKLGSGQETYKAAKRLLQRWRQFQLGWTQIGPDTPIEVNQPVAVVAHTLFLWTINPLRITYTHEGPMPPRTSTSQQSGAQQRHRHWLPGWLQPRPPRPLRWQFAHGCVSGHMLQGEEAFRLDWDPEDDSVWFEVLTFSRPVHPLAIISYPITRYYQQRFARDSVSALMDGLRGVPPPPLK